MSESAKIDKELCDAIALAVIAKLQKAPPIEKVVWSGKECAEYLKVSPRHFIDRLSKHHKFPAPMRLPSEGDKSHYRWFAADVIKWLEDQR